MSSASAIRDALITMLSAASNFGSGNVAKSFDVMETSAGSCAAVSFRNVTSVAAAFGNDRERTWTMGVIAYIRDQNDPSTEFDNVVRIADNVITCLDADDTVLGTVHAVNSISISRDPERFVSAGGATWLPVEISIELKEL